MAPVAATNAMTDLTSPIPASLPYASPQRHGGGSRAGAGFALVFGGLGLVLLGGSFLIGVLLMVVPDPFTGVASAPGPMTAPQLTLMVVLYALAFACFAGAGVLLLLGTRGLLRVLRA